MIKYSLCLVTNEMYPFLPGGIGRLMYNFADRNQQSDSPVDLHFLLPAQDSAKHAAEIVAEYDGRATIHFCPSLDELRDTVSVALRDGTAHHPEFADNYKNAHLYHIGLLRAQNSYGRDFDVIEIPDFGGWGAAITSAKRAGLAYQDSLLSFRLHSAHGLITQAEKYTHHPSFWFGALLDLEREGLANADLIVGHIPSIVQANCDHYQFDQSWADNAIVEFPPITVDTAETLELTPGTAPDFIFSSRLQPFKRPDIFIKAATCFMERNPDYEGVFRVVSYGWDREYVDWLKSLVPTSLATKVLFLEKYTQEERLTYLARSVVVVPSNYESLCLFAFEASNMGCPVILNRDCLAFGDFDRWIEGENCLMFDGEFLGLAKAMEEAVDWRPTSKASIAPSRPYWEDQALIQKHLDAQTSSAPSDSPDIAIVYFNFQSTEELNRVWAAHQNSEQRSNPTYFLLNPNDSRLTNGTIQALTRQDVKVHLCSGTSVSPSELQAFIATLDETHVCLCPANYALHPKFLTAAKMTLAHSPDTALFSSHSRVLSPTSQRPIGVNLYSGGAQSLALLENVVAPGAAVVARNAVAEISFDEMARDNWYNVFTRNLALSGRPIVIAPTVLLDHYAPEIGAANDKCLSASIYDTFALKQGLIPRMLAFDPKISRLGGTSRTNHFGPDILGQAMPVTHTADLLGWDIVQNRQDLGGVLIHPVDGEVVIAEVKHVVEGYPIYAHWRVSNVTHDNNGVEVATVFANRPLTSEDIERINATEAQLDGVTRIEWKELSALQEDQFSTPLAGVAPRHVYLMSRVPTGRSSHKCWPVWKELEFIYNHT